jgi:ABC-type sugar transport system permease subunit
VPTVRSWLLAAVTTALVVAGNTVFAVASASDSVLASKRPAVQDIAGAVAVDPSTLFVATLGNEVEIVRDGRVTARAALDATVGGIAASADGATYYAGTSLGTVYTLDAGLHTTSTRHLPDGVEGMRVGANGALVVAHGAGTFGQNSTLDTYPAGGGAVAGTRSAGSTVSALDGAGNTVVYGTLNARVGMLALDDAGGQLWQTTLPQPVTSVAAVPQRGWVLAGDKTGGLTLLDEHGAVLGSVQVSDYPLTTVGYDVGTGQILTGDQHGSVSVVDGSGHVLVTHKAAGSAVRALVGVGSGDYLAVSQRGPWSQLDVGAAHGEARAAALRPWWITFDALLAAGLIVLFGLTGRRRPVVTRTVRRIWRARLAYLMVAPTVLLVAMFTFYPALSAFYYSFTDFNLSSVTQWVGLENYRTILTDDSYFWAGVRNMGLVVGASVLKTVTVPLLAAELVYWLRNAFHQYLFRTLFVLSAVVPTLVITLLWKQVYDPYGLLNSLLSAIGLGSWQHAWLGDEATALWSVIAAGFPYLTAFPFLIFLGGLLTISRELYDSAAIDGAGRWRRFVHVDLPHLRPHFRIVSFFAVVGSVEGFASIFVLTNGGPGTATYVPALEMYARIGSGDLGYASAIGVLLFTVIVAATMFILRFRRSAMEVET